MPLVVNAFTQAFLKSPWFDSVVQGINRSGDTCQYVNDLEAPCDLAMHTSGVKAIKGNLIDARRFLVEKYGWRRLVVESRCFRQNSQGGKDKYWRLSLSGFLDDEAIYHPGGFVPDASRWEMIKREQDIELKPWRTSGTHILLCGQKPSDASLRGQNVDVWFRDTIKAFSSITDRTLIVRPHPLDHGATKRLKPLARGQIRMSKQKTIEGDLKDCWAAVTFTSLSLIEAACAGIPIFAMNSGNLAWRVANQDITKIESPSTFDREPWLWDLAYRQWKVTELEDGHPWRRLRDAFIEKAEKA